jgi:hypothetical protein
MVQLNHHTINTPRAHPSAGEYLPPPLGGGRVICANLTIAQPKEEPEKKDFRPAPPDENPFFRYFSLPRRGIAKRSVAYPQGRPGKPPAMGVGARGWMCESWGVWLKGRPYILKLAHMGGKGGVSFGPSPFAARCPNIWGLASFQPD